LQNVTALPFVHESQIVYVYLFFPLVTYVYDIQTFISWHTGFKSRNTSFLEGLHV